jgi:hypothetical protein
MRLTSGGTLGRGVRPHGPGPNAEPPHQGAAAAFGPAHAEAGLDPLGQVSPAPADHARLGQVGTGADPLGPPLRLGRPQAGLGAGRRAAEQPGQALIVEPVTPIAPGLPIHAAAVCRVRAAAAFQDPRRSQHPPGRVGVLGPGRRPAHAGRVVACPRDRNGHPVSPQSGPDEDSQQRRIANPASQHLQPLV